MSHLKHIKAESTRFFLGGLIVLICLLVGCDSLMPSEEDDQVEQVTSDSSGHGRSRKSKNKIIDTDKNSENEDEGEKSEEPDVPVFVKRTACELPEGVSNDLGSINDLISLVNALPMPVDLACILDVLPKKLFVRASDSISSVQPAEGLNNPRIFIFINELVLAIVAEGKSSEALEFSFFIDAKNSIKGEIPLPVTAKLDRTQLEAALSRPDGQAGTTCGGCHFEEVEIEDDGFASFSSLAVRPRRADVFEWEKVIGIAKKCDKSNERRCEIYQSLFFERELKERPFNSSIDVLF